MRHRQSAFLCIGALILGGGSLLCIAHAAAPTDAVSGASRGDLVTVKDIAPTSNSAKISFSEKYPNGELRLYCSTTAFASTSDTTRATVKKVTVAKPRSGVATVTDLVASTKYYCKFQGWFGRGEANYWATFSFTTTSSSAIRTDLRQIAPAPGQGSVDALGRGRHGAAGVALDAQGAVVRAKTERR